MKFLFLSFIIFTNIAFGQLTYHDKLYEELKSEFEEDFPLWGVQINRNDSMIRFSNHDILFAQNSSQLKDSYKVILQDFFPRYIEILSKYKDIIDNVAITGHTSSENVSALNESELYKKSMLLSQKRAKNVLEYVKSINSSLVFENKDWIEDIFLSEGVSFSEPIVTSDGLEDKELSKRVEFVILYNDNFQNEYVEYPKETENFQTRIMYEVPRQISPSKEEAGLSKKISLKDYINELLVKNPTLNEQYYLLKSLQQDIEKSKALFRPTVSLNYSYTKYNESEPDDYTDMTSQDVTVRYNLFNGFKDQKELKITEYSYLSSKYKKEQIELDLIYSLIESYLGMKKADGIFELSRGNYGDYMRWEEKSKIKFENGLLSLRDYSKIQARSINRYINFEEDTKRFTDAISTMNKYIDFSDEMIKYLEEPDPKAAYFNDYNLALEDSRTYSPFVKEAAQNITLSKEKLNKAKVNFLPSIDLVGKKNRTVEDYENASSVATDETTLAFQASLELYSGGKDKAEEQKKFFEYKQKLQKKEEVEKDVRYKVDLAINNYNSLLLKHQFFKDLVTKREEEFIAANYDFKFAKIDENDLLDIMDSLYNARRQFIENKYDFTASKYKMLKEIGILKDYLLKQ